jgi:S-adenosylmethionine hydrolase
VIVALLTDFGTRDHYVGVMKAVVLSLCANATLVDITHDIPPQDLTAGAFELAAAYRYFPAGTVFLVVIDPGVGSTRRAIAVEAGGYFFVGPDNGVLSLAFRDVGAWRAVELTEQRFARPTISNTFEGRDRFAPAAGWLARGMDLSAFGAPVAHPQMLDLPATTATAEKITGEVIRVDRFGNLITNIRQEHIDRIDGRPEIVAGPCAIEGLVTTYADTQAATPCALIGSSGYLEIAVRNGNAAETLGLSRGAPVSVQARRKS